MLSSGDESDASANARRTRVAVSRRVPRGARRRIDPIVAGRVDRSLGPANQSADRRHEQHAVPGEQPAERDRAALNGAQRARQAKPTKVHGPRAPAQREAAVDAVQRVAVERQGVGLQPVSVDDDASGERGRLLRVQRRRERQRDHQAAGGDEPWNRPLQAGG